MAEHLTEEEQLETLKRWWAENGKSMVVGVVLAVAAYLGWGAWQDKQQADAEMASEHYQLLLQAVSVQPGVSLSADNKATARHLIGELKGGYENSMYASLAALFESKLAIADGDLVAAQEELKWVIDKNVQEALTMLTKMRLARLQITEGKLSEALQTVADTDNQAFKSAFAEVRGDAHLASGDVDKAKTAYQLAINTLLADLQPRQALLEMKLQDLNMASSSDAKASGEPEA